MLTQLGEPDGGGEVQYYGTEVLRDNWSLNALGRIF
jgi:hypothetical protein